LITFPLIVLAILATIGGLISLPGNSWLNHYLIPILPKLASAEHHLGTTEYLLMAVAVIGGLVGIGLAYAKYNKQNTVPGDDASITGFAKVLYNKYYLDEIYNFLFVSYLDLEKRPMQLVFKGKKYKTEVWDYTFLLLF
jgi:NADH-quinone oxidoreductase subunit L